MKRIMAVLIAVMLLFSVSSAKLSGDITLDGKLDINDAEAVQEYITNKKIPDGVQKEAADINADGVINSRDIAVMQICIISSAEAGSISDSSFSIHFMDVGQADAALVECDGRYMLIDGGNKDDSSLIYSVLKNAGAGVLDIVIATHAHEDHIGGLSGALNYAEAKKILCSVNSYDSEVFEDFVRYANENGGIEIPKTGDVYSLGSAKVKILGVNGGESINDTSIILKITYKNTSFLFTGDAERDAEQAVLESGDNLNSTVLKVGHHGADTSTTYPFLREIMPEYAVISVGEGNSYGHPTENTLSRLKDADVTLFRTDLQGDVYCTSDGYNVSFSVEKNANADVFSNAGSYENNSESSDYDNYYDDDDYDGEYDYIVNISTKKFHYPSCSSVSKMKESNKEYFSGTREELVNDGYSPCGNCKP